MVKIADPHIIIIWRFLDIDSLILHLARAKCSWDRHTSKLVTRYKNKTLTMNTLSTYIHLLQAASLSPSSAFCQYKEILSACSRFANRGGVGFILGWGSLDPILSTSSMPEQ